ncbi:MAG: 50S ribosomal protein L15 [Chloroflexi bacterium]|nr:50S ribosomal protein L15 [Chloroflexota bacterium]
MKLHELAPAPGSKRERRRVGRGHGSGRVKTAGKGTKGQNARSGGGVKPFFEGGQNPWTMRIPHKRGFSRARFRVETQIVNLRDLERVFAAADVVTRDVLAERGLIDDAAGRRPVKILGEGTLTKRLSIEVDAISASARQAVEQAGGTVTLCEKRGARSAPQAPASAVAATAGETAATTGAEG